MQQDRRTLDVWHQGLHLQSCRQFSASIEVLPILNPGGEHTAGQANPGCPASGFVPTVLQAALSLQGSPAYLNPGGEIPPKCQPI